jgi:predicted O-methyltransferase YrrM
VTPEEAQILQREATGLRCLEIGTGLGVSTMALAVTAASLCSVDSDDWVHDAVIPELSLDDVVFVRELSEVTGRFDMAFVDGCHTKASVLRDLQFVATALEPEGRVFIHDCYIADVAEAIAETVLIPICAYPTRCSLSSFRYPGTVPS